MKVFGIDPGSRRTGYGCVETDGIRHRLLVSGAIVPPDGSFPDKLRALHRALVALLNQSRPACVAVESIFYAANVRSALRLGHVRGVALLAASEAGVPVAEYSPAEIKRAVVGYGRAEKIQVQQMVRLLLDLPRVPRPHDVADALAVAICHAHTRGTRRHPVPSWRAPARLRAARWRDLRETDLRLARGGAPVRSS